MFKKYTSYRFLLIAIILLFSTIQPALALEATYPNIEGNTLTGSSTLLDFIKYFFIFAVAFAGIVGVISIVIAGFQILVTAGSPTAITDAKERIFGAILGIALLFASFIILRTINPTLVNPSADALPQQAPGTVLLDTIYNQAILANGNIVDILGGYTVTVAAPPNDPNVVTVLGDLSSRTMPQSSGTPLTARPRGSTAIRQIRYNCTPPTNGIKGPRLLVSIYDRTNFIINRVDNGSAWVTTSALECNAEFRNAVRILGVTRSYRWEFEEPGIYFGLKEKVGESCPGIHSQVYTQRSEITPFNTVDGADGGIVTERWPRCIKIVNDRNTQFGVVLNESKPDPIGTCSWPMLNTSIPAGNERITRAYKEIGSIGVDDDDNWIQSEPKYAYVFRHIPDSQLSANAEIKFQGENLYFKLTKDDFITSTGPGYRIPDGYDGNLNNLLKEARPADNPIGKGVRINDDVIPPRDECRSLNPSCLKWIRKLNGNFRVILYAYNETDWLDESCYMYNQQEDNFEVTPNNLNRWLFNGQRKVYDMSIIPMPN